MLYLEWLGREPGRTGYSPHSRQRDLFVTNAPHLMCPLHQGVTRWGWQSREPGHTGYSPKVNSFFSLYLCHPNVKLCAQVSKGLTNLGLLHGDERAFVRERQRLGANRDSRHRVGVLEFHNMQARVWMSELHLEYCGVAQKATPHCLISS